MPANWSLGGRGRGGKGLGKGDIGCWDSAPAGDAASPGEQLLLGRIDERSLSDDHVRAIVATAAGPSPPAWTASLRFSPAVLTKHQCTELIARADAEFAAVCDGGRAALADMKIGLACTALDSLVGAGSAARLHALGKAVLQPQHTHLTPHFILRRRCVLDSGDSSNSGDGGSCERIVFHRDHSLAVVSIALNDNFRGGRLLFAQLSASGARVTCPQRPVGSALAHNDAAVHGVSGLVAGVRYHLFAVYNRGATDTGLQLQTPLGSSQWRDEWRKFRAKTQQDALSTPPCVNGLLACA